MQSYSQNKEDIIVLNDLGVQPKTMIDIGANNGKTFSNSLMFIEQFDTRAICVEADPYAFIKLFEEHKHRDHVECVLGTMVSDDDFGTPSEFILFNDSLISTTDPVFASRWTAPKKSNKPIYTAQLNWASIEQLTMYLGSDKYKVDVMSIDVEGINHELIQCMPITLQESTNIIIVERGTYKADDGVWRANDMKLFESLNRTHALITETSENLIYARK